MREVLTGVTVGHSVVEEEVFVSWNVGIGLAMATISNQNETMLR